MKLQICILFALRIYITIQQTSHLSWPLDPFSIQKVNTGYPSPLKPIYQMQKDLMVPQMTRPGNVLRLTPKEQVGSETDDTRPVWLYSLYYLGKRSVQCAISSVALPLIFSLMQYGSKLLLAFTSWAFCVIRSENDKNQVCTWWSKTVVSQQKRWQSCGA